MIKTFLIMIALLVTVLVGVSLAVGREISRPMKVMTNYLEKNASQEPSATALRDEHLVRAGEHGFSH